MSTGAAQSFAPGQHAELAIPLAHYYVDSSHVWKAPNGTGYVVGYFISQTGQDNAAFSAGDHGLQKQSRSLRKDHGAGRYRHPQGAASALLLPQRSELGLAVVEHAKRSRTRTVRNPKPARSMKKPEKARSMTPEPSPAVPGVKPEDQLMLDEDRDLLLANLEDIEKQSLTPS